MDYDDAGNQITSTLANGLQTQRVYNSAGLLVSEQQLDDSDNVLGTTSFAYYDNGLLWYTQSPTGERVYQIYDDFNRLVATVDAAGYLTERTYDDASRVETLTQYATPLSGADMTALAAANGTEIDLVTYRPTPHADDRTSTNVYDDAGRLEKTIDALGVEVINTYDASHRLINTSVTDVNSEVESLQAVKVETDTDVSPRQTTLSWSANLPAGYQAYLSIDGGNAYQVMADGSGNFSSDSVAELFAALQGLDNTQEHQYTLEFRLSDGTTVVQKGQGVFRVDAGADSNRSHAIVMQGQLAQSETRSVQQDYDLDGLLTRSYDAEGYVTDYFYDGMKRLVGTTRYATAVANVGDEPVVLSGDLTSRTFYNARGLVVGRIAENRTFTEYGYDLNGQRTQQFTYKTSLDSVDVLGVSFDDAKTAAGSDKRTEVITYDGAGGVTRTTNYLGVKTEFTYNKLGQLIATKAGIDTNTAGTDGIRETYIKYDIRGNKVAELTAEGVKAYQDALILDSETDISTYYQRFGVTYEYDAANRLIAEYHPDGANGNPLTRLYYYTARNELAYVVSSTESDGNFATREASVVAMNYNAFGQLSNQRAYTNTINSQTYARIKSSRDTGDGTNLIFTNGADPEGNPISTSLADVLSTNSTDNVEQWSYTKRGELETYTDALGFTTSNTYNAFGELKTVTQVIDQALGTTRVNEFHYTARGQLVLSYQKDSSDAFSIANATAQSYDAFGRSVTSMDNLGRVTANDYSQFGREVTVTSPLGHDSQIEVDAFGQTKVVTDALGNQTTYTYDDVARTITTTSAVGVVVTTTLNLHGQVEKVEGNGQIQLFTYNANGQQTAEKLVNGSNNTLYENTSEYDDAARIKAVIDGEGRRTEMLYDHAGRVYQTIVDPDGLALTSTNEFDGQGRLIKTTDTNGVVSTMSYDAKGQLVTTIVDPDGEALETRFEYNGAGQMIKQTAAYGSVSELVTTIDYDEFGRQRVTHFDPDGKDIQSKVHYNEMSEVIATEDAEGQITRLVYDNDGRLAFSIGPDGKVMASTYDANGNVIKSIDYAEAIDISTADLALDETQVDERLNKTHSHNQQSELVYDGDNRLVFELISSGRNEYKVAWHQYQDGTNQVARTIRFDDTIASSTAKDVDSILAALDAKADYSLLDVEGNLLTDGSFEVNNSQWMAYRYDAAGRVEYSLTRKSDDAWTVVQNHYDKSNNVIQSTAYANTIAYQPNTDVAAVVVADGAHDRTSYAVVDNAGRTILSVDGLGFVTRTVMDGNRVDKVIQYADAIDVSSGNYATIKGLAEAKPTSGLSTEDREVVTYGYDSAGRVTSETDALGESTSMVLDDLGRTIRLTDKNGNETLFLYDSAGRVTHTLSADGRVDIVKYDDSGRVIESRTLATKANTPASYTDTAFKANFETDIAGLLDDSQDMRSFNVYDETGLRFSVAVESVVEGGVNVLKGLVSETRTQGFVKDINGNDTAEKHDGQMIETLAYKQRVDLASILADGEISEAEIAAAVEQDQNTQRSRAFINNQGLVTHEVDALGYVTKYTYDDLNQLASKVVYKAQRNFDGIRTEVQANTYSSGAYEQNLTFTYDLRGQKVSETIVGTGADLTTTFARNAFGEVTRTETPRTMVWSVYNQRGEMTHSINELGEVSLFKFNAMGEVIESRQLSNTQDLTLLIDGEALSTHSEITADELTVTTSDNDRIRHSVLDARGQSVYQLVRDGDEAIVSQIEYDALGNVIRTVQYDQLIDISSALSDVETNGVISESEMDDFITAAYPGGDLDKSRESFIFYDNMNRARESVAADGSMVSMAYDAFGHVVATTSYRLKVSGSLDAGNRTNLHSQATYLAAVADTQNSTSRAIYNELGQRIADITPENNLTLHHYNALGQLSKSEVFDDVIVWNDTLTTADAVIGHIEANRSGAQIMTASQLYDLRGQVVKTTLGDGINGNDASDIVHHFRFDALGRRVVSALDDGDGVLNDGDDKSLSVFNNKGQQQYSIDANGFVTLYSYSTLGEVTYEFRYDKAISLTTDTPTQGQVSAALNAVEAKYISVKYFHYDTMGRVDYTRFDPQGPANHPDGIDGYDLRSFVEYNQFGEAIYQRDEASVESWTVLDNLGRVAYQIDGSGRVTGLTYNALGDVVSSRVYAEGLSQAQMDAFQLSGERVTVADIEGLISADNTQDIVSYTVHDAQGRALYQVMVTGAEKDAQGNLTGNYIAEVSRAIYDGKGQVVQSIQYNAKAILTAAAIDNGLSQAELETALDNADISEPTNPGDTSPKSFNFYDEAGRLVVSVDPSGMVTRVTYDGFGNAVLTELLAIAIDTSSLVAGQNDSLPSLSTSNDDQKQAVIYDEMGRAIYSIDGEGHVTKMVYNAKGQLAHSYAYSGFSVEHSADATAVESAITAAIADTSIDVKILHSQSIYDSRGQVVKSLVGDVSGNDKDHLVTVSQIDALGRVVMSYVDADNDGELDDNESRTRQVFNSAGLLQYVITDDHVDESGNRQSYVTEYLYKHTSGALNLRGNGLLIGERTFKASTVIAGNNPNLREVEEALTGLGSSATQAELETALDGLAIVSEEAYSHDNAARVTETTHADGTKTTTTYDVFGRVSKVEHPASGAVWSVYDAAGRVAYSVNELGEVSEVIYDVLGRAVETRQLATTVDMSALVNGQLLSEHDEITIDELGAIHSSDDRVSVSVKDVRDQSVYSLALDGDEAYVTKNIYDGLGRVVATIAYDKAIDISGVKPEGISESEMDGLITAAYPGGDLGKSRQAYVFYNARNEVTHQVSEGGIVKFEYDAFGNVVKQTAFSQALSESDFATITAGDESSLTSRPSYKLNNSDTPNTVVRSFYNELNQLVAVTNGQDAITVMTYDALGRLEKTEQTNAKWDSSLVSTDDVLAQALSATQTIESSQTYTLRNQVATSTSGVGANAVTGSATYDALGRTIESTLAGDNVSRVVYNSAGQVRFSLVAAGNNSADNEYFITESFYDATTGQLTHQVTYQDAIEVTESTDIATEVSGATTISRMDYQYDELGRVEKEINDIGDANLVTEYGRNQFGEVVYTKASDGVESYTIYNRLGQATYTVNHLGEISGVVRNEQLDVVASKQYADTLTAAELNTLRASLTNASIGDAPFLAEDLEALFNADVNKDITNYQVTDSAGNTTYNIAVVEKDGGTHEAQVTKQVVDGQGRVIYSIAFASQVSLSTAIHFADDEISVEEIEGLVADLSGQESFVFYDDTAGKVTTVNAAGQVSRVTQNELGLTVLTERFATLTEAQLLRLDAGDNSTLAAEMPTTALQTSGAIYDNQGRMTHSIDAEGFVTRTFYNAKGQAFKTEAIDIVDSSGNRVSFNATDTAATIEQRITDAQAVGSTDIISVIVSTNIYDLRGNVIASKAGDTSSATDSDHLVSRSVFDALGREVMMFADGDDDGVVDSTEGRSRQVFDTAGRVIFSVDAEGYVTEYIYATNHDVTTNVGKGRLEATKTYQVAVNVGDTPSLTDVNGQLDIVGRTTVAHVQYDYDDLGRVKTTTNSDGTTATVHYDVFGREVSGEQTAAGQVWNTYYDNGLVKTQINGRGEVTHFTYDAQSQLIATRQFFNVGSVPTTNTVGSITLPAEHASDRINYQVIDEDSGRVIYSVVIDSVSGTTASGIVTEYRYDNLGRVEETIVHGKGISLTTQDDDGDLSVDEVNSRLDSAYGVADYLTNTIDLSETAITTQVFNDKDQVIATADGEGVVTYFVYNAYGQQVEVVQLANQWDGSGELASHLTTANLSDSGNQVSKIFYNELGQQVFVINGEGNVTGFEYDAQGRLEFEKAYQVDGSSWSTLAQVKVGVGTAVRTTQSVYNLRSEVTETRQLASGDGADDLIVRRAFDALGRLVRESYVEREATSEVSETDEQNIADELNQLYPAYADYRFIADTGSTLSDHSGNEKHAIVYTEGDVDLDVTEDGRQAVYFGENAVQHRIIFPDFDNLKVGTIEMTLKLTGEGRTNSAAENLLQHPNAFSLKVGEDNQLILRIRDKQNATELTGVYLTRDEWQHLTVSYETGKALTIYLNGEALYTTSYTQSRANVLSFVTGNYLQGYLDNITFRQAALDEEAIKNLSDTALWREKAVSTYNVYNAQEQLIFTIDAEGYVKEFEYDSTTGQLIKEVQWDKAISVDSEPTVDEVRTLLERIVIETGEVAAVSLLETEYVYDATGRLSQTKLGTANQLISTQSYNHFGEVATITDAAGVKSYSVYDKLGRKLADINAKGEVMSYHYNDRGELSQTKAHSNTVNLASMDANSDGVISLEEYLSNAPTGHIDDSRSYVLNNQRGEMQYSLQVVQYNNASGLYKVQLQEMLYDNFGRVFKQIAYAETITLTGNQLADLSHSDVETAKSAVDIDNAQQSLTYYDKADRAQYTVDAEGTVSEVIYDDSGLVQSSTLYATQVDISTLTAESDISGLIASDSTHDQTTYAFYNSLGQAVYSVDALGYVSEARFDGLGRVTDRLQTNAQVDASNVDLSDIADAVGAATELRHNKTSYDANGQVTSEVIGAHDEDLSLTTSYEYDAAGRVIGVTYPNGGQMVTVYDDKGRVHLTRDALGAVVENHYNNEGRLVATTQYATVISTSGEVSAPAASDEDRVTYITYDELGRISHQVVMDNDAGAKTGIVTEQRYDTFGNVFHSIAYKEAVDLSNIAGDGEISAAELAGVLPTDLSEARETRALYDRLNRAIAQVDALGHVVTTEYDTFGNVVKTTQLSELLDLTAYSDADLKAHIVAHESDVDNRVTRSYFNERNELETLVDATGAVTTFEYDAFGNAISQKQWANRWDESVQTLDAFLANTANSNHVDNRESFQLYNQRNEMIYRIGGEGYVQQMQYNVFGQVSNNIATNVQVSDGESATSAALMTLISSAASSGTLETRHLRYQYDKAGRQTHVTVAPNSLNLTTITDYDALGNVIKVTNADSSFTETTYDVRGQALRVRDEVGNIIRNEYNTFGEVEKQTAYAVANAGADLSAVVLDETDADNRVTTMTYDDLGRVLTSTAAAGTAKAVTTTNTYNSFSDVISQTVAGSSSSRTTTMAYNKLGQLVLTTYPDGFAEVKRYNDFNELSAVINRQAHELVASNTQHTLLTRENLGIVYGAGHALEGEPKAASDLSEAERQQIRDMYTTRFGYNDNGQRVYTVNAHQALQSDGTYTAQLRVDKRVINAFGEMTQQIDAYGTFTGLMSSDDSIDESLIDSNGFSELKRTASSGYDKRGLMTNSTDFNGTQSTQAYNAFGEATVSIFDTALNATETTNYYDEAGRVDYVRDMLGNVTDYTYDAMGRVTEEKTGMTLSNGQPEATAQTRTTAFEYYANGTQKKVIQDPGADNLNLTTQYEYNAFNQATKVTDNSGGISETDYDVLGQALWTRNAEGYITSMTYSEFGEVLSTREYATEGSSLAISELPVETDDDRVHSATYDVMGRVSTTTNVIGMVTEQRYDAMGNVVLEIVNETDIDHDGDGVGDGVRVYENEYDNAGRQLARRELSAPPQQTPQAIHRWDLNSTKELYDDIGGVTGAESPYRNGDIFRGSGSV